MFSPQVFIFYGISGSGKGTQARLLIDFLKRRDPERELIYIETGARIRSFIANMSGYTRDKVKEVIDRGGLLPEFIPIWLWSNILVTQFTGREHLILDGAARRAHESPVIESALKFLGFKIITIILIDVSREWAKERLKGRGRYDDDEEEINRRFDWYEKNTKPAFDYFRQRPGVNLIEVNGERLIEEVHAEIIEKLNFISGV
jgi:adenylate kinase